jgi:two-component sensor histidine kinase
LGLIANELITNAIKHRGGARAEVRVVLETIATPTGRMLSFSVADRGPGLPPDFDAKRWLSLGMRLVTGLAAQIGGQLEILPSAEGTTFRILALLAEQHDPDDAEPATADGHAS